MYGGDRRLGAAARARGVSAAGKTWRHYGGRDKQERAEAGVWVIAENQRPACQVPKNRRTMNRGRYVLPGFRGPITVWSAVMAWSTQSLSRASWIRTLTLPQFGNNAAGGRTVYPANYWAALIEPARRSEFRVRSER